MRGRAEWWKRVEQETTERTETKLRKERKGGQD
jgi:hypothetical protein